ncbi:MAG TPA: acyl-CoA dehydrogenase, partial [Candidatus Saccharimonadales bacterium]|nr:acyl-CoA dehydrogenase [Candidatus Saccharimonadales bacterium]
MPSESLLWPGVAAAVSLILPLALLLGLLYRRRAYLAWTSASALAVAIAWARGGLSVRALLGFAGALVALALITGLPPVRRLLISRWVMALLGPLLPRIGETERIALEAGTVWWDRDLFSGDIDWRKLMSFDPGTLSPTESAFLDGPVREVCGMLDEWEISRSGDLPPDVWRFLKDKKFLGMIIPEEYGGLGFSARAHSAVVTRLASRSLTAAVTVMVPNSLGPAELILHYGTPEQKSRYLPRLATGDEIPCFALTGPEAGSDAAATRSEGIVCRGVFEGREVLGMRLSWNKRYITLAPVATVIGLAFRLRDPDHLLGDREDLGITCALIPAALPGVETGERHDPLGIPFLNGPTFGTDVFVPLDVIIGGRAMAGQGWRMLMERLAAGRSISLPALSVAASQLATRVTGAYGTIREQFGLPIGRFEGIEEPLARIGGMTYLMSAAASLTAGAVDSGQSPAVLSAVVKAYLTEGMRSVVNDAMDIVAGAGICRGPRNTLALAYQALPIAITVEGANILTRSMIIFGQGSIRSHPFVQEEIRAVEARDVRRFDRAFFGHAGAFFSNATRALVLGLTGGRMAGGGVDPRVRSYAGRLSRMSAAFAVVADTAMATLGGALKRKEKITGRLADALAWLYLGTAALKRFHDEGCRASDLPYVRWASHLAIHRIQQALLGTLDNLPGRFVSRLLRPVIFPRGALSRPPSDGLGGSVARGLLDGGEARER